MSKCYLCFRPINEQALAFLHNGKAACYWCHVGAEAPQEITRQITATKFWTAVRDAFAAVYDLENANNVVSVCTLNSINSLAKKLGFTEDSGGEARQGRVRADQVDNG
jgi:hypothetical protein